MGRKKDGFDVGPAFDIQRTFGAEMDNESGTCYDKLSTEKGRGPGTLTTLRPT
jgi:hypothetical protein